MNTITAYPKPTRTPKKTIRVDRKLYDALTREASMNGLTPDQLNEKLLRDFLGIYR